MNPVHLPALTGEVFFFGYKRNNVMMPMVPVAKYRPSKVQATLATIDPPGINH